MDSAIMLAGSKRYVMACFIEKLLMAPTLARPEHGISNTSAVVVLGGIKDTEQAKELLRVYLDGARTEVVDEDLLPFDSGAVDVLREVSDGRPGVLLSRARELLNAAAEQALPKISRTFARQYFEGQSPSAETEDGSGVSDSTDDIDDLLLGRRN